jgi:hypothetical protein
LSKSGLPLTTLAGTIKAHIAAGDKSVSKAKEHYRAAGIHLMEARERVKRDANMTWSAFLASHCNIGSSRAYESIDIAQGTKTLTELRAEKNASAKAAYAKVREAASRSPLFSGRSSDIPQSFQSSQPTRRADDRAQQIWEETPEYARCLNRLIQKLKRLDMEALEEIEQFMVENYDV